MNESEAEDVELRLRGGGRRGGASVPWLVARARARGTLVGRDPTARPRPGHLPGSLALVSGCLELRTPHSHSRTEDAWHPDRDHPARGTPAYGFNPILSPGISARAQSSPPRGTFRPPLCRWASPVKAQEGPAGVPEDPDSMARAPGSPVTKRSTFVTS